MKKPRRDIKTRRNILQWFHETGIVRKAETLLLVLAAAVLYNYFIYFNFIKPYKPTWQWPVTGGWTILGRVPLYNDELMEDTRLNFLYPDDPGLDGDDVKFVNKLARNTTRNARKPKIILNDQMPEDGSYQLDPDLCGGLCHVTCNKSLHKMADAIVVGLEEDFSIKRSNSKQLYVWRNQQSPWHTAYVEQQFFEEFDNFFNLTMSYRRDSDVYYPLGTTWDIQQSFSKKKPYHKLDLLFERKDRLAAWDSGGCSCFKGYGPQRHFIMGLIEVGLNIDSFNLCLELPTVGEKLNQELSRYKFYFAFEDVFHCRDYISGQTWERALKAGVIPVIWGPMRADVEAVLPFDSFIFVEDFSDLLELADYLTFLGANKESYLEYFQWRIKGATRSKIQGRMDGGTKWVASNVTGFCQLCHLLHDDDLKEEKYGARPQRVVESLYSWWYMQETKVCLAPSSAIEYLISFWCLAFINFDAYTGALAHYRFHMWWSLTVLISFALLRLAKSQGVNRCLFACMLQRIMVSGRRKRTVYSHKSQPHRQHGVSLRYGLIRQKRH